jgi:hypothetical protein
LTALPFLLTSPLANLQLHWPRGLTARLWDDKSFSPLSRQLIFLGEIHDRGPPGAQALSILRRGGGELKMDLAWHRVCAHTSVRPNTALDDRSLTHFVVFASKRVAQPGLDA